MGMLYLKSFHCRAAWAARKWKDLRGYSRMPPHHLLVSRKSDGLQPSRRGNLELVSLSFRFLGLCWAMINLLGMTSPKVLLKIFL